MDTNEEKVLFKDEVFQIIGCAIEVLNTLGHGIVEKPYENALVVEFGLRQIPFKQQPAFDVVYKGQRVGALCPRPYRLQLHCRGHQHDRFGSPITNVS
jgi:GxxExxY protein